MRDEPERRYRTLAAPDDVRRIVGTTLDDVKLMDIMALRPTILDVEEPSLWLAGDSDVFGVFRRAILTP